MEDLIKKTLQEMLQYMGVACSGIVIEHLAGQTLFRIETVDTRNLIGAHGDTLHSLEYILKKMLERQGVQGHFTVDVDGYRSKQITELEQRALMMAERARSFEYDVELSPMSAYERLIVHAALSGKPGIKTESQGEGKERRVVIKYSPHENSTV